MSAGCVHTKASVILAAGFVAGSLAYGSGVEYAIGALVGIALTPDLDVDAGYHFNKTLRDRIGFYSDKVWDVLWYSYRKSLKHGGPLSHFPIIGTVGRLAYLYFFLLVIPDLVFDIDYHWWNTQILLHWKIIVGLMGSDLIHYALDILTKENANNPSKRPCRPLRLPFGTRARAAR